MKKDPAERVTERPVEHAQLDEALARLAQQKRAWAQLPLGARIDLLERVRQNVTLFAGQWVSAACVQKGLPSGSPLEGEEWSSGPWALLTSIDVLLRTLRQIKDGHYLEGLKLRTTTSGQIAATVFPQTLADKLLLSGVSAEVWMKPGVTAEEMRSARPCGHGTPISSRTGGVALVLGAGNITSIAPLDAIYKLFAEHCVCLVKLNPITAYLKPTFEYIFSPLTAAGCLVFVAGGSDVGSYLTTHSLVETLHITGSRVSHDAIVFGIGPDAAGRKAAGRPLNMRPITSELGAVCPTIVVPGNWTRADLRFQAAHVATQKLHNSGFNCVASQILILPRNWPLVNTFLTEVKAALARAPQRPLYYPGTEQRMAAFKRANPRAIDLASPDSRLLVMLDLRDQGSAAALTTEVFGPALGVILLDESRPAPYLDIAVRFANQSLHGTLGANVIIDPATERALGPKFEQAISELRYGCVGVNAWTGLGFLLGHTPWGAFPGHPLNDVQSGQGFVHNGLLLDRPQRSIVRAPFRPFPRGLRHGSFTMLPVPPWFVTNRTAAVTARRLLRFQAHASWWDLPAIFFSALRG